MARIVKEEEYNTKRSEILDVALRLIYTKGYEQMTIQDILDGLNISRGALYHYFDSKHALLEALVERMGMAAEQTILPIVQNPHLSALQKLQGYFEASASWKSGQKEFIISLLRIWYSDENALIRQKLTAQSIKHTAGLLEPIIRQGIQEQVFTTPFPEQVAQIMAGVTLNLTDALLELMLSPNPDQLIIHKSQTLLEAYIDTIERIVGAAKGSLKGFGPDDFKEWYGVLQPESESK
jgi:TetR/AcrR family transcriptional regulator, transcriptional repressor for nem operon